ncbi:sulfurtransferase [Haloparvum sp. PAK95]|uniref:sulfurtransferase n=1 Tax=Haloparvum sp. PAK95 TaxID=3418962 RepID=UPI003D2F3CBB
MDEIIVDASALAARLDDPGVHAVDVREEWEYDAMGHVPGAVNVPFETFRGQGDADVGHLPGAEAFANVMGEAGLSRSDTLVAYDDTNGVFAARFLVTALVYGFTEVHLLNGDFSAWQREHPVDSAPVELPAVEVEPLRLPDDETPIVDADYVRERIDAAESNDEDVAIVDTRDANEYAAGHLPGAVRFDWQEAVDPETRGVKPKTRIRELFAERGITPDDTVILYCNTARRLSHTYVALRWAGFTDVAIYEGSLTEWREIGGELVSESD